MKQVERKRFGSLIAFGIFSTGFFAPVLIAHQPVDCSERKSRAREGGNLGWLRLAKVEDDEFGVSTRFAENRTLRSNEA